MFMECCCYKKIITLKFHQLKFSTILLWSQKREKKIKLITNPKKFPTMKVISIRFLEKRKEREREIKFALTWLVILWTMMFSIKNCAEV